MSVKINDKDVRDFGLILLDGYLIEYPEVKTKIIDIPGSNGVVDLTEALTGFVPYKNRQIQMELIYISDSGQDYHIVQSEIMNFCHGQQVKLIFDNDPDYFWKGRVMVSTIKNRGYQAISIAIDAEPFKYSIRSSADNWLWDPFNFLTDIANQLKELQVVGTLETTIVGSIVPTNPIIASSNDMQVTFNGNTYPIKKGTFTYYSINLKDGKNTLTFTGNGVITIDVRGGSL